MPRYTTVEAVRASLRVPSDATAVSWAPGSAFDVQLAAVIDTAEAQVDGLCGQEFDLSAASTRFFRASAADGMMLPLPAVAAEVAAVELGDWAGGVWAPAAVLSVPSDVGVPPWEAAPYRALVLGPARSWGAGWVAVTGTWGWPSVPVRVSQASLLGAVRLFSRQEAPLGVLQGEMGSSYVPGTDPDFVRLLRPMILGFGAY